MEVYNFGARLVNANLPMFPVNTYHRLCRQVIRLGRLIDKKASSQQLKNATDKTWQVIDMIQIHLETYHMTIAVCVERDAENVYRRLAEKGSISLKEAKRNINRITAILDVFRELIKTPPLPPDVGSTVVDKFVSGAMLKQKMIGQAQGFEEMKKYTRMVQELTDLGSRVREIDPELDLREADKLLFHDRNPNNPMDNLQLSPKGFFD